MPQTYDTGDTYPFIEKLNALEFGESVICSIKTAACLRSYARNYQNKINWKIRTKNLALRRIKVYKEKQESKYPNLTK